jgi:AcrR family transcriptional regulator
MSPRRREIVETALRILEAEGRDALTMRRLAGEIGIRAPSLYKHFPDKAAVEIALIEIGFTGMAEALEAALEQEDDHSPLERLATAYRQYALDHPHLYRLLTGEPLPRERLRPGVEDRAAWPLVRVVQDPDRARALWAFAHGMVILELNSRFPPNADLDAAWRAGVEGFEAARRRGGEAARRPGVNESGARANRERPWG